MATFLLYSQTYNYVRMYPSSIPPGENHRCNTPLNKLIKLRPMADPANSTTAMTSAREDRAQPVQHLEKALRIACTFRENESRNERPASFSRPCPYLRMIKMEKKPRKSAVEKLSAEPVKTESARPGVPATNSQKKHPRPTDELSAISLQPRDHADC